jgi:hypothetical protein
MSPGERHVLVEYMCMYKVSAEVSPATWSRKLDRHLHVDISRNIHQSQRQQRAIQSEITFTLTY